jgi:VanZ family protein
MRSRFAALAVVLLASPIPARSQPPDDQERCAAQARKAFQEWENLSKKVPLVETLSSDYESHYNTKIRKCLIVISGMSTLASGKGSVTTSVTLMDAYERYVYAN